MPVSGKLRILNGGSKNGVTTLYVRVRVAMPTPAAIVATVKIEKIHNGFFGSKATISIPKLAGGSGSLTSFSATIKKQLLYKGKRFSPLTLKCPSGIVRGAANAIFGDGTTESTEVFRTCTGKG